jgi:hypothetical protein
MSHLKAVSLSATFYILATNIKILQECLVDRDITLFYHVIWVELYLLHLFSPCIARIITSTQSKD